MLPHYADKTLQSLKRRVPLKCVAVVATQDNVRYDVAALGIDPIEKDDCVLFDDIAVGFGEEGRVNSLYRVIDGSTTAQPNR